MPQRLHWWKAKLGFGKTSDAKSRSVALLPVHVAEARTDARRGEPVTVLLRRGHMIKVGRDFGGTSSSSWASLKTR